MSKPTEEQLAVINSDERIIWVEAGPGTGKTFTLIHRIKWLVEEKKLKPTQKILMMTFTNVLTNANRKSILESLGERYQSYVEITTLDAFVYKILCDVCENPDHLEQAGNYEQGNQDFNIAERLFITYLSQMSESYKKLLRCRYPYILIDEIQDIFQGCSKSQLLDILLENHYVTFVGNKNQKIMDFNNNATTYNCDCDVLHLTLSFRNKKLNYCDYTPDDIDKHIQPESISFQEACDRIKNSEYKSFFISLNNWDEQIDNVRHCLSDLPYFKFRRDERGQLSLPQAVIKSLLHSKSEKLYSFLCVFKRYLKPHVSFSYFFTAYFQALTRADTFERFIAQGWKELLNADNPQVRYLNDFLKNHSHLNKTLLSDFKKEIIVSTIHSLKGLEADIVFLYGKPAGNLNYVAKTRHKSLIYSINNL